MSHFKRIRSCPKCNGNRQIKNPISQVINESHFISEEYIVCPRCNGRGMIEEEM